MTPQDNAPAAAPDQDQDQAPQAPTEGATAPAVPGNVWLVEHPTHQWAEDVKALARKHQLQIVDPAAAGPDELAAVAADVPELTRRGEVAVAVVAPAAAVAVATPAAAPVAALAAETASKGKDGGKKARP